jgi:hypothetical protein
LRGFDSKTESPEHRKIFGAFALLSVFLLVADLTARRAISFWFGFMSPVANVAGLAC